MFLVQVIAKTFQVLELLAYIDVSGLKSWLNFTSLGLTDEQSLLRKSTGINKS